MTGGLLIGVSSIGKTHLVGKIDNPRFLDADEIISSTIGFPQTEGQWWDVLSEEELQAFGEEVYETLVMYAKDNWVIGGIGPIPSWVPDLMARGINVYFITAPKEQLERNVQLRYQDNPDTKQPVDLDAILSWYVDTLDEMTRRGVPSIAYDDIERQFNKWLAARRPGKISFHSIYTDETNNNVAVFSWNKTSVACNTSNGTVYLKPRVISLPRHDYPKYDTAKWYQPGAAEFNSIARDAEILWFRTRRSLTKGG